MHVKSASFSTDNSQTSRFSFFNRISNDKNFGNEETDRRSERNLCNCVKKPEKNTFKKENFIPKYLHNALTDSVLTSRTSRRLLEEKAPVLDFGRTVPAEKYWCKHNR